MSFRDFLNEGKSMSKEKFVSLMADKMSKEMFISKDEALKFLMMSRNKDMLSRMMKSASEKGWEINESILNELKNDKEAYQKFFNKMLRKYGVESPDELSDDDKKKFYDEIDRGWKADDEE